MYVFSFRLINVALLNICVIDRMKRFNGLLLTIYRITMGFEIHRRRGEFRLNEPDVQLQTLS